MTLRNRNELKSFFKNKTRLSETHFSDFIDSVLNQREDQFHGKWRPGRMYRLGDVVIFDGALWEMTGETPVCAQLDDAPSKEHPDWRSLIIPDNDNDWEVVVEEAVMWAKYHQAIGIGVGALSAAEEGETPERPAAKLDVKKAGLGRWMLFPQENEQPQVVLLNTASEEDLSYLCEGLSLEEATWLTDAVKGFAFRKGQMLSDEAAAAGLDPAAGQVMLVLKPKRLPGGTEVATLGLNVEDPTAMLDMTDGKRGQLLFSPEEKLDPALSIVNLDPHCDKNYLATGVGKLYAALVSDAPYGFTFLKGEEYNAYCAAKNINQGDFLMVVRQQPGADRPQVGIGAEEPEARLDVMDGEDAQVLILPLIELPAPVVEAGPVHEQKVRTLATDQASGATRPVIAILQSPPSSDQRYLTAGLGEEVAGWVTNAVKGFVFRQGGTSQIEDNHARLDQGQTQVSIREDGKVGIGTETPYTRLEVTNPDRSGRFLFNLERKVNPALSIINLKPGTQPNYLAVGATNEQGVFITDSTRGFAFQKGAAADSQDNELNINQGGDPLLSILPQGRGRVGIGRQPLDYELDLHGMGRAFTLYQATNSSTAVDTQSLQGVLDKVKALRPVSFRWNQNTGFKDLGKQLGFLAHELEEEFPEVIRTASDGSKSIAYGNLTAVLTAALQQLAAQRDEAAATTQKLEEEFKIYQEKMEEKYQALEKRIRNLE
jgi:hypothetical protein